jgi:hypothetical protein
MHEDPAFPSSQAGPPMPPTPPAPPEEEGAAAYGDAERRSTPGTIGAPPAHRHAPAAVWRHPMLWLFAGVTVVAAGIAATALVRKVQTEQALGNVARATSLAAAAPESPERGARVTPSPPASLAPVPPAAQATPGLPASQAASAQAAPVASVAPVQAMPATEDAARARGGGTGIGKEGKGANTATPVRAAGDTRVAKKPRADRQKRETGARAAKRGDPAERRVAARRAPRDSATFKRCPPLGKKGAVMCRWHICNGAAGKERACRPYLERKP